MRRGARGRHTVQVRSSSAMAWTWVVPSLDEPGEVADPLRGRWRSPGGLGNGRAVGDAGGREHRVGALRRRVPAGAVGGVPAARSCGSVSTGWRPRISASWLGRRPARAPQSVTWGSPGGVLFQRRSGGARRGRCAVSRGARLSFPVRGLRGAAVAARVQRRILRRRLAGALLHEVGGGLDRKTCGQHYSGVLEDEFFDNVHALAPLQGALTPLRRWLRPHGRPTVSSPPF